MGRPVISPSVLSKVVKTITPKNERLEESQFRGTIVFSGGEHYIQLDGAPSDSLTPIANIEEGASDSGFVHGDRVLVLIKNHQAIVTKNLTTGLQAQAAKDASAFTTAITDEGITAQRIIANDTFTNTLRANGITADEIIAGQAIIDTLDSNYAHITNGVIDNAAISYADVDDLSAHYAHITNGVIDNAKIGHADVNGLNANYAHIISGVIDNATIDQSDVNNLSANYAHVTSGVIDNAKIGHADVNGLNANYAHITNGVIDNADIDVADVRNLSTTYATIENLEANYAHMTDGVIDNAKIGHADVNGLNANYAHVTNGTIDNAKIGHADVNGLNANYAHITNGTIDNAKIGHADVNGLNANYAHITNGTIDNAKIGYANVNDLDAHYAEIDLANVNNAWMQNGVIKNGAIADAQIIGVSANKLTAGTIDASNITVTNLNASNITTGTINGQRIGAGSLSLDKLADAVYTESEIDGMLSTMQAEIDGAIETFTGTVVPTLNNAPASSWTTADEKAKHVGDVYYVVNAGNQADGYCYRFAYDTQTSTYSWVLIKDSDVTAALQRLIDAEGDISDLQEFESETSSWISNTDEELSSIKSNHTSLVTVVDKTIKESVQLWFTKANTTAPSKPTAEVTNNNATGSNSYNKWNLAVPQYNASYPNYFYCYQWKYVDNTFGWSAVTRDIAMGETQSTARTAASDASSAVSTANTASNNASAAVSTANTASSNASAAISTANTANSNASTALSTANSAASDASAAVSTANTASSNASAAVSTANSASSTATAAQNTANANIKSTVQLWFTKANTTAPNKPTAHVTNNNATGSNSYNKWNLAVPEYNASYPNYFYCYEYQKGDNTYSWSDVVLDKATTENQANARSALTQVATKVETSTFNTLSQTVNSNTANITSLTTTTTNLRTDLDNLEIGGRNLFAISKAQKHKFPTNADGLSSDVNCIATDYILVEASKTMIYQVWVPETESSNLWYPGLIFYDGDKHYIGGYSSAYPSKPYWKTSSVVPANAKYMRTCIEFISWSSEKIDGWQNGDYDCYVKIEAGTKPTDWTLAPEDTEASVTAVSNTVNEVKQTATSNSSKISNLTTTLGTNADGTTAVNDIVHKASAIEQDLNGFKTTVSSTYQTKDAMSGYSTTSQMNTAIQQSANAITQSVSETYQTKADMDDYSTTSEMNSAINQKAGEITSSVSQTYATKTQAQDYATTAETNAKNDTATKLQSYSTTTQMNSAINQKANEITSAVSETYQTKSDMSNYSTTTQMNSAINQKADAITASVESTYTTKTDFNALEIGGKNLYTRSYWSFARPTPWYYGAINTSVAPYLDADGNCILTGSNGQCYIRATGWDYYSEVEPNCYYTLSVKLTANEDCTFIIYNYEFDVNSNRIGSIIAKYYNLVGGETKTIVYTFKTSATTFKYYPELNLRDTPSTTTVKMHNKSLKLEKGNKATDWTPAPEDLETETQAVQADLDAYKTTVSQTYATQSSLTQTASSIRQEVSAVETTTKSYTDGKITQEVSDRNSAITQKANEITNSVSSTYATKASLKTTSDNLADYISSNNSALATMQDQIDGAIETWFYTVDPTNSNAPASSWNTTDLKNIHLGDLYYNTTNGHVFRWQLSDNTYSWIEIEDTDARKALADAAKAQTTADNKRRVFVAQPTTPYDIGDLWVQGTSGDIMRCSTARASGSYTSSDWIKASKYTDDSTFNNFKTTTYDTKVQQLDNQIALTATKTEVTDAVTAAKAEIKVTTDGISTEVSKKVGNSEVISKINQSAESVTIDANRVNIAGATIFTSGRLSTTSLNNAYDVKGAASAVQTNLDNLSIGGRNLVARSDYSVWGASYYVGSARSTFLADRVTVPYGSEVYLRHPSYRTQKLSQLIPAGTTLTCSVEVYEQTVTDGHHQLYVSPLVDPDTDYVNWQNIIVLETNIAKKYIWTYTPSMDVYGFIIDIDTRQSTSGQMTIGRVKVEIGNKATAWSPAPEDALDKAVSIYCRTNSSNVPATSVLPAGVVSNTSDTGVTAPSSNGNGWTLMHMPRICSSNTAYKYLWTCNQLISVGGYLLGHTDVVADNGTTVINGDEITTGTISADRLNIAGTITAINNNSTTTINGGKITATSLELGKLNTAAQNTISNSAKTATDYITYINASDGIKVHNASDTTNYAQLNSNGMTVVKGGTDVAQFGTDVRIGRSEGARVVISPNELAMITESGLQAIQVENNGSQQSVFKRNTLSLPFTSQSATHTVSAEPSTGDTIQYFVYTNYMSGTSSIGAYTNVLITKGTSSSGTIKNGNTNLYTYSYNGTSITFTQVSGLVGDSEVQTEGYWVTQIAPKTTVGGVLVLGKNADTSRGEVLLAVGNGSGNGFEVQDGGRALVAEDLYVYGNIYPNYGTSSTGSQMADFVIEQGTSGIWTYRKWNSGIKECWGAYTASIAVTTSSPGYGGYRSGQLNIPTFPVTFTNPPVVTATVGTVGGAWINNVNTVTTTGGTFYLSAGASYTASNRTIYFHVIGK